MTISDEASIDDISLEMSDEDVTTVVPSLPEILMNSCLIPTLASYLRNDSGTKEFEWGNKAHIGEAPHTSS